jgi:hypothetical protein
MVEHFARRLPERLRFRQGEGDSYRAHACRSALITTMDAPQREQIDGTFSGASLTLWKQATQRTVTITTAHASRYSVTM